MTYQQRYVSGGHSCVMYSAWNPKDNYDMSASHSQVNLMLSTDIDIKETTYSYQF